MAAVAPVLFPEMKARGAKPGDLVALLSATGAQTETIPPSLVLITIGSVTGVSIAALFTGGMLPGLVLALTLCAVVWWRYRDEDLRHVRRASAGQIGRALVVALPALVLPFLIRAAVVEGVATATEVSTIGIAYSLAYGVIAAFVFRDRIDWRRLWPALVDTASSLGRDPPHHRHRHRDGLGADPVRLLAPARRRDDRAAGRRRRPSWRCRSPPSWSSARCSRAFRRSCCSGRCCSRSPGIVGIHEVHYAMVVILSMGIGLFAPPFGVGYYAACAIGRVDPAEGIRPIWPYLLALLVGIIVVAAVPWISVGFL